MPDVSSAQRRASSQLRTQFRDHDKNADGVLSKDEAKTMATRAGMKPADLDKLDTNKDGKLSFQEAQGLTTTAAHQQALDKLSKKDPLSLAGQLDKKLPAERFDYDWQRERVLDRAQGFETDVRKIVADAGKEGSPLSNLRKKLGARYAKSDIQLHGVASHSDTETLQAVVKDKAGKEHTYTMNSKGEWIERPDLQWNADRGRPRSRVPGLRKDKLKGQSTFGVATVKPNNDVSFAVPDVSTFDHQPRVKPWSVGDVVQVSRATGKARVADEGKPYQRKHEVEFGKLLSSNGSNKWKIQMLDKDGKPQVDKDGKPIIKEMTDTELRRTNNPHVVADGTKIYDSVLDETNASQKKMVADFWASDAGKWINENRPGPGAPVAEKVAFEKEAIKKAEAWLDTHMVYPDSKKETAAMKKRLDRKNRDLALIDAHPKLSKAKQAEAKKTEETKLEQENKKLEQLGKALDTAREATGKARTKVTEAETKLAEGKAKTGDDKLTPAQITQLEAKVTQAKAEVERLEKAEEPHEKAKRAQQDVVDEVKARIEIMGLDKDGLAARKTSITESRDRLAAQHKTAAKFWELESKHPTPNIGEYLANGTGQCRHQALGMQVLMQQMGIDARMSRGAANTGEGNYRGEHMWLEATLSDGSLMMVDPTWDTTAPLDDIYNGSKKRMESPSMSEDDYKDSLAEGPRTSEQDIIRGPRRGIAI